MKMAISTLIEIIKIQIIKNLLASASVAKYLTIVCCHRGTCHARKTKAFNKSIVPNIFSDDLKLSHWFLNFDTRP